MIEIREVTSKKEIKAFIEFPLNLYRGNPYYVPCLYSSERDLFKKNNPYVSSCDAVYFCAYKDNVLVGRISGIIQRDANEKWKTKNVRFTRFDSIDNQEVANALFDAVTKWAKEKGMDTIVGPLGFNDLEREGLLIEGFDYLSTFEEQYNFPYYEKLIENYGFTKDIDWLEKQVRLPKDEATIQKINALSEFMYKHNKVHFVQEKSAQAFVKKYKNQFFELLDDTYSDLYGTCPLRKEVQKELIKGFNLLLRSDNVCGLFNEKNEMVCFGLYFPSIAKAVQKSEGKLTPIGIYRILKAINNPNVMDFGLVGIRKDYRDRGLPAALLSVAIKIMQKKKLDHFETNLTLEDNEPMLNLFKHFDTIVHKRRRSFKKKI